MLLGVADIVVCYLAEGTVSPISLLELGLLMGEMEGVKKGRREVGREGKETILVGCPDGFGRKGNVQIICERYGVRMFEGLEELGDAVEEILEGIIKDREGESC